MTAGARGYARAVVLAAVVAGAPLEARAGNTRSYFFGNDAALSAGSDVAGYRGISAFYHNPAGLGGIRFNKLELSGTGFQIRARPTNLVTVRPTQGNPQSFNVVAPDFGAVPTTLVLVYNANERLSYGIGVLLVDQLIVKFNEFGIQYEDEGVRYDDSVGFDATILRYYFGAGFGYEVSPRLRVGGVLFATYATLSVESLLFSRAESATDVLFSQQLTKVQRSRFGVRGFVGAQWDIDERWSFGAVFRTPNYVVSERGADIVAEVVAASDASGATRSSTPRWAWSFPSIRRWILAWASSPTFHPKPT